MRPYMVVSAFSYGPISSSAVIDSHAHLDSCPRDSTDLLAEARGAGVRRVLTVGTDETSNRAAIGLAERHEEVLASVGRHPNQAEGYGSEAELDLEELAAHPRVRAIGETGLDWYREGAAREVQRAAFSSQIGLARKAGLPLVIHMRDSAADVFDQLRSEADGVTVILHCFSAGPAEASEAAVRGWYCSFAGNVTYPRAEELRRAAASVPEELLLVETDAPYLAPQAVRGRPSGPADVRLTAQAVAAARDVALADLERAVEANAARLFGW